MLLTGTGASDNYLQFMTVLILFVFVLLITYATTKWIANYQKGRLSGGNIEVMESFRIAPGKYVQIVRMGNHYLAIAIGKDEVHMLAELSEDELVFLKPKQGAEMNFGAVLEKFKKQNRNEDD